VIDIEYLKKIRLVSQPLGQKIVAYFLLLPNYNIFQKVDIRIENAERIPRGESVIFAMNHTDRFNYWPFQYKLLRMREFPFTTVWVKAKYYKNAFLAKGLDLCNLIPVPSMGYLIEEYYRKKFNRKMDKGLYRAVKDMIEGRLAEAGPHERAAVLSLGVVCRPVSRARSSRLMEPSGESRHVLSHHVEVSRASSRSPRRRRRRLSYNASRELSFRVVLSYSARASR